MYFAVVRRRHDRRWVDFACCPLAVDRRIQVGQDGHRLEGSECARGVHIASRAVKVRVVVRRRHDRRSLVTIT